MASKTAFTAEEWEALRNAPHYVSMAVATAGSSGVTGTLKEAFASAAALVEGTKSASELVRSICAREEISAGQHALRASLPQLEGSDFAAAKEKLATLALDAVRQAVEILKKKAPDELAAYRGFVKGLAERVAQAAKEGGFLGFGGERVSAGEKAILSKIDEALGAAA
jgi:hypothetical protein